MDDTKYYLELAASVAERSDCKRKKVGALIVWQSRVVAEGWIRPNKPDLSCKLGDCPRGQLGYGELPANSPYTNCISVHAEMVAIRAFAHLLYRLEFSTGADGWAKGLESPALMYSTHEPCHECKPVLERIGLEVCYSEEPGLKARLTTQVRDGSSS